MFPENAPSAPIVFFNAYSHNDGGKRETWKEVCDRTIRGIKELGKLTDEEAQFLWTQQYNFQCLASGRSLWTSGRAWIEKPVNFPGAYNCTSLQVNELSVFGLLMNLAMMGCGTGAVLTAKEIDRLPTVCNELLIEAVSEIGTCPARDRCEKTKIELDPTSELHLITIRVGDSREGWVTAYQELINIAFDPQFTQSSPIKINVDLSSVRSAGEKLKGFGGISNPIKLPNLFHKVAAILNGAINRQLNSVECCLLIDEAAIVVVAGNVRRSAGIRLFDRQDGIAAAAKDNLWMQDEKGNWKIDPKRDALRMANHSRLFDQAPTLEELTTAVNKQYLSGEGAIEWEGEALARGNSDLWVKHSRHAFLEACKKGEKEVWLRQNLPGLSKEELSHRISRSGLNPCGR